MSDQNNSLQHTNGSESTHIDQAQISFSYPDEKRFTLADGLLIVLRNRRLILATVLLFLAIGVLIVVVPGDPEYRSTATVIREGESRRGSIPSLSQFGIDIGGTTVGLTAEAYPDIIKSREVRLAVVRDTFYVSRLDSSVALVDYLNQTEPNWLADATGVLAKYSVGLPGTIRKALTEEEPRPIRTLDPAGGGSSERAAPPTAREASAMGKVQSLLSTRIDRDTGLMTILVTTDDPELSAALVESFIRHLEERVRQIKTEKSRQNVEFVRERFAAVGEELRQAEEELAQFMDRNTSYRSAQMHTEAERLQRQVQFKAQLYTSLQTQLTQAELDLQRSNPVITVLEAPVAARGPLGANPEFTLIFCLFLGIFVGVGLAVVKAAVTSGQDRADEKEKWEEIRSRSAVGAGLRRSPFWSRGKEYSKRVKALVGTGKEGSEV